MANTRISDATYHRLARLAAETGMTHQEVLDLALRNYEQEVLLDRMNESFAALRNDEVAWQQELEERAGW